MEENPVRGEESSVRQMRALLSDCFQRRPAIYWLDMLVSSAIAYPATLYFLLAPGFGPAHAVAYLVAGFALFRVGSFIHEIQHMRQGEMTLFKAVWNVLCGVPLLMTSNMYDNHADHHSVRTYATERDGEYLPLADGPPRRILSYFLQVPLLPLLAVARFGILGPISLLSPRLRRWVLQHASSYGINTDYVLSPSRQSSQKLYALRDLVCGAYVIGLVVAVATGWLPIYFVYRLYFLVIFTIGLNWTRNLVAHRYRGNLGPVDIEGQLEDTVTITGGLSTELLFPIGLRYHSLHHALATVPYHQLGRAHRRLVEQLDPGAPYRTTLFPTFVSVVRQLLADARAGSQVPDSRPA